MRKTSLAILFCVGLIPTTARAQDDVKKQLEALKLQLEQNQKQTELIQKTLKEIEKRQMTPKELEDFKKSLEGMKELQKTVGVIDQRTAPRAAPINYRAEPPTAPAQLFSSVGGRRGGPILSPYLNLIRGQDASGLLTLGIDYGLNTRAEIQRRSDARQFSGEIGQLQQQAQQPSFGSGISTTGFRSYFDQSYGRPAQQLYRRTR